MAEMTPGMRHTIQQHGGVSSDTRALLLYEANKKTALVAYLLWFFLGMLGGHNFYLKRTGVAVAQLILTLTLVGMLITIVWVIVDAFLIPGWVRGPEQSPGDATRRLALLAVDHTSKVPLDQPIVGRLCQKSASEHALIAKAAQLSFTQAGAPQTRNSSSEGGAT